MPAGNCCGICQVSAKTHHLRRSTIIIIPYGYSYSGGGRDAVRWMVSWIVQFIEGTLVAFLLISTAGLKEVLTFHGSGAHRCVAPLPSDWKGQGLSRIPSRENLVLTRAVLGRAAGFTGTCTETIFTP